MAFGIDGVRVGLATDTANATGCTVILPPEGSVGAVVVRGGAPGTREAAVLGPFSPNPHVHAVVLCGSSLFGLRAASGVADWCVEQDIGLDLAGGRFPIVGAAVVLDIRTPDERRIDDTDGRAACNAATTDNPAQGLVGAGTGCTAAKVAGRDWAVPGGQGWAVERSDDLVVASIMAVNPVGEVFDTDGSVLAATRAPANYPRYPTVAPDALLDADGHPVGGGDGAPTDAGPAATNTVIGCVVTNASLDKIGTHRVADMAHTGIARAVSPAHTSLDGDAMFAIATGVVDTRVDLVADLAAATTAAAIRNAVIAAGTDTAT